MSDLQAIQHYCAYQERCHSEVRHKLLELHFRGGQLEDAIASLIADNFLNEERFARSYCRGKFKLKQWGRKKIVQALQQKQVSVYCIRQGLKEIDDTEYIQTLNKLLKKKLEEYKKAPHPAIRKQKSIRYLLQRGFEYELIQDAWESLHAG